MTDNEKLIEEAARAILASEGIGPEEDGTYWGEATWPNAVKDARTAFAVFERAHTPTDDEREALERVLLTSFDYADIDPSVRELSDAILAAGFRRSVVPEPSAEVDELREQIEKLEADLGQQIDRTEELHNIADRLSWAIAPMSEVGEHSSANDPWENAIEYAESRVWAEPQGEPSDAQKSADEARAHALHDAFWAVHVGRFHGRDAEHGVDTFYAGTNAAKRAIESLHGVPIIRPWPATSGENREEQKRG